jgi:hypothetical protein
MHIIKYTLVLIVSLCLTKDIAAQRDLKIGQWKTYLPYHYGIYVAQSDQKVYYSTPNSILIYDKAESAVSFLDKASGLSEGVLGRGVIKYNQATKLLIVTYANSNIDLIAEDGTVTNISDIKDNKNILGDKSIQDIYCEGKTAYFSCGFGVTALDLVSQNFLFTTFTKTKVNALTISLGTVYAATEKGLYAIQQNATTNIANFNAWKHYDVAEGYPPLYRSRTVAALRGRLYFSINDTLFSKNIAFSSNTPSKIRFEQGLYPNFLTTEGSHLLAGFYDNDITSTGKVLAFNGDSLNTFIPCGANCASHPTYALEDSKGNIWFADEYDKFRNTGSTGGYCSYKDYNSPSITGATDIAISPSGKIIVPYGGLTTSRNNLYIPFGFGIYNDRKWININSGNAPIMKDSVDKDCYRAVFAPDGKKAYVGTFYGGLIEVNDDKVTKIYNDKNSAIQKATGDPRERIGGLAYDTKGNLWISNNSAPNPIVVLKKDGTWKSFGSGQADPNIYQVIVDGSGYKWFVGNRGITIYDEGKKIDDPSDDRYRLISNTEFPTDLRNASVNALAVDLDGTVWVGTTTGVMRFDCGNDPFGACLGREVISALGGINEYLLREKNVLSIAVDDANRKWFGTSAGIFVQNATGQEEVAKFSTSNSPLLSNNINSLAINHLTGEVYVGTDNGLMSYQSDAVVGNKINQDSAYAYPNPVRLGYDGPIAIMGLARDANVKITNINGQLVYETKALGGQAIWSGNDFSGRRVATGVYLVFATNTRNTDNPDTVVTKILIMNN